MFANVINRKANKALCAAVAELIRPEDEVLKCACGTGLLTGVMAPRCRALTATDFSAAMLRRAERKYGRYPNMKFEQADITRLGYPDASFDAVVAANVIHLLDAPYAALCELDRVCRPGGRLIIPTYMNQTEKGTTNSVSDAIGKAGADKIVVLSDGVVAEQGAPDALYAQDGIYTHMVQLQTGSQNWTI